MVEDWIELNGGYCLIFVIGEIMAERKWTIYLNDKSVKRSKTNEEGIVSNYVSADIPFCVYKTDAPSSLFRSHRLIL